MVTLENRLEFEIMSLNGIPETFRHWPRLVFQCLNPPPSHLIFNTRSTGITSFCIPLLKDILKYILSKLFHVQVRMYRYVTKLQLIGCNR